MKKKIRKSDMPARVMNMNEAAAYLGLHPITLRRAAKDKKITYHVSPGGHYRFHPEDVEKYYIRYQERANTARTSEDVPPQEEDNNTSQNI